MMRVYNHLDNGIPRVQLTPFPQALGGPCRGWVGRNIPLAHLAGRDRAFYARRRAVTRVRGVTAQRA